MKELFLLTLLIAGLSSSCSQSFYQFPVFESENTEIKKLDELVIDHGQVEIGFSFYGHDTPFQIRVLNKSENELLIDWRNVFLNVNGKTYELFSEMSKTWMCSAAFNRQFKNAPDSLLITEYEQLVIQHGKKSKGDTITRISPKETMIFNSLELQKDTLSLSSANTVSPFDVFFIHHFDKENSPFQLALHFPIESLNEKIIVSDTFWVNSVYKVKQKQFSTPYLHKKSMNMATLYNYKEKKVLLSSAYYISTVVVGTVAIWMSRGATYDPDEIGD